MDNNMDFYEQFDYTDELIDNCPITPQFLEYYGYKCNRILKRKETFHDGYKNGTVIIDKNANEPQGLDYFEDGYNKYATEYENELKEKIGNKYFNLYYKALNEWVTNRNKSETVKEFKRSIYDYLVTIDKNFTILHEKDVLKKEPLFSSDIIKLILEINKEYSNKIFEEFSNYDEAFGNWDSRYCLYRGINTKNKLENNNDYKEFYLMNSYSLGIDVAISFSVKRYDDAHDNKHLIFGNYQLFENLIIGSCLFNKPLRTTGTQHEFIIIPNTKQIVLNKIGRLEDIDCYQLYRNIDECVQNPSLKEYIPEKPIFNTTIHELVEEWNSMSPFILKIVYKNLIYLFEKLNEDKLYKIEVMDNYCQIIAKYENIEGVYILLDKKIFENETKSLSELFGMEP